MFITWCVIIGLLLVLIGLTDTLREPLPIATSAIYLLAGYLLGPDVSGLLDLRLVRDAVLIEHLSEAAVLVSLFAVGLRLRVPIRDPLWRAPLVLATLGMVLTIGLLVGVGVALGLSLAAAVLLAAVLAPTDPVLASDVQVRHSLDRDRLRFSLTGEGGLNDGAAFPFVMLALGLLGLHDLGTAGWRWFGVDVLWATFGGIALGWTFGHVFSRAVIYLRHARDQAFGMESFLTLGLIALTYGIALALATYGFLAVFAAGLAMRQVEREANPMGKGATAAEAVADEDPATDAALAKADPGAPGAASAEMAKTVLDFTLDLEKLAEMTVMLLIGSLLTASAFTPFAFAVAAALLFVARPVAVYLSTWRSPFNRSQRRLVAWFGVRGIGSIYYLAYAVSHGAEGRETETVTNAVLVTIVASALLHGSSAAPVMRLYRHARGTRR
jgi:sodium/hydrogen antiporter